MVNSGEGRSSSHEMTLVNVGVSCRIISTEIAIVCTVPSARRGSNLSKDDGAPYHWENNELFIPVQASVIHLPPQVSTKRSEIVLNGIEFSSARGPARWI